MAQSDVKISVWNQFDVNFLRHNGRFVLHKTFSIVLGDIYLSNWPQMIFIVGYSPSILNDGLIQENETTYGWCIFIASAFQNAF